MQDRLTGDSSEIILAARRNLYTEDSQEIQIAGPMGAVHRTSVVTLVPLRVTEELAKIQVS